MSTDDLLLSGRSQSFAPSESLRPSIDDNDHIANPGDHRGPYAALTDPDLEAAYERVAADPDDQTAPLLLSELVARGIATS